MERSQISESILRTVELEISSFLDIEPEITCPIEYENTVIDVGRRIARTLITNSRGEIPKGRNAKKKS